MARKTKKEKIIANLRRELRKTDKNTYKPSLKKVKKESANQSVKPVNTLLTTAPSYFAQDLKKTLALSTLAISLVFMLYFILNN